MLRAQKSSTWQLNREGDSCWADSAHRIKNCLCTLSGSMQLVRKRAGDRDKKTGQLLTLISDEIARLDSLVKDLLIAGETGSLHRNTHEMKDVLERASAQALECLGMTDSISVEFRQPIAQGAVSADYKMFLWSWVTMLSSVFKWAGPRVHPTEAGPGLHRTGRPFESDGPPSLGRRHGMESARRLNYPRRLASSQVALVDE